MRQGTWQQTTATDDRPRGCGATRTGHTQRRGEERRRRLLESAAELIGRHDIENVSLDDIARAAGIPVSSAYHFYRDKDSVLAALGAHYGEEFERLMQRPLPAAKVRRWEDVLELLTDRAVRYYAANPTARKLLIDGKAPAHIKLADRIHDRRIGTLLETVLARHFELPKLRDAEAIFYNAVEIVDVMLQVSVIRSARITPFMVRHAKIAAIAYLREFLPRRLISRAADVASR